MKNKFFNDFKKSLKKIDDAELGRELRKMMARFRSPGGNVAAHATLASKLLAFCAGMSGSTRLEQEVRDLTVEGKNMGNFKITVERIEK